MTKQRNQTYHFKKIDSARSRVPDESGLKKISFVCEEVNTDLFVFLWVDANDHTVSFQFFFFENVIEWSDKKGPATFVTNRAASPDSDGKIGIQKGIRTFVSVDDPTQITKALEILENSEFPDGTREVLLSGMHHLL